MRWMTNALATASQTGDLEMLLLLITICILFPGSGFCSAIYKYFIKIYLDSFIVYWHCLLVWPRVIVRMPNQVSRNRILERRARLLSAWYPDLWTKFAPKVALVASTYVVFTRWCQESFTCTSRLWKRYIASLSVCLQYKR